MQDTYSLVCFSTKLKGTGWKIGKMTIYGLFNPGIIWLHTMILNGLITQTFLWIYRWLKLHHFFSQPLTAFKKDKNLNHYFILTLYSKPFHGQSLRYFQKFCNIIIIISFGCSPGNVIMLLAWDTNMFRLLLHERSYINSCIFMICSYNIYLIKK